MRRFQGFIRRRACCVGRIHQMLQTVVTFQKGLVGLDQPRPCIVIIGLQLHRCCDGEIRFRFCPVRCCCLGLGLRHFHRIGRSLNGAPCLGDSLIVWASRRRQNGLPVGWAAV